MSLAFFGAFRISELVAPSKIRPGGLMFEDTCLGTGLVECFLRRSKTDQRGRGVCVTLYALRGSLMCPVEALRQYRECRGVALGPLLIHADGSYLSQFQFVQIFRRCLTALGRDAGSFSSHSFRIGAATEAARWGLSKDRVKKIGRWESDRYKLYVRPHLLPV